MSKGKAKVPLAKHLVKVDGDDEEVFEADTGLHEAIGRYAQRTSSQKSRAVELDGTSGRKPGDASKAGASSSKVGTGQKTASGHLKLQEAADTAGTDLSDDDEEKYEMMSRGTLKARSQALVEVIQGVSNVKLPHS